MKKFTTFDDKEIFYREWNEVKDPKAVLMIVHGMAEHIGRYEEFANYLNENKIIVIGMDSRGHGKTGEKYNTLGHFDGIDWHNIVFDLNYLRFLKSKEYPNLPFFLMGHSMGSFMARYYITRFPNEFDGAIIMGTGSAENKLDLNAALYISTLLRSKKQAKFLQKFIFGRFNNMIKNPRTGFDWICSVPEEVDRYLEDPYCGLDVTNGFYNSFFFGIKDLSKLENDLQIPKDMPIFVVAGEKDPVGNNGKDVEFYYEKLKNYGIKDLKIKLYENMRHEILQEFDKERVYKDLKDWILERVK
ncbi:MAG: alpha/beta hydrolase [Tissierellia bacterium]|nr:alpha/beta hydrolase [Tissierellia bacterium]